MSQETLNLVRRHIDAYGREDVPGALSFLDPFVVWDPTRLGGIDANAAYGHDAVADAIARYVGAFKDYVYTVIDRKIARMTVFPSEAEALEAAGLSG